MNYKLINGVERHKESPETFEIPTKTEIEMLAVDSLVKLGFEEGADEDVVGERMWVVITKIIDGKFEGKLDNDPTQVKAIKAGDSVVFAAENILAIWYGDNSNSNRG